MGIGQPEKAAPMLFFPTMYRGMIHHEHTGCNWINK